MAGTILDIRKGALAMIAAAALALPIASAQAARGPDTIADAA